MRTCEACFREHTGTGRMCGKCNNMPAKMARYDLKGRKQTDVQHAAHMDMADGVARNIDDGWFYDDEDDRAGPIPKGASDGPRVFSG